MKSLIFSVFRKHDRQVGGFADRIKGLLSANALSIILSRKLQVFWPCDPQRMGLLPRDPDLFIENSKELKNYSQVDLIDWSSRNKGKCLWSHLNKKSNEEHIVVNSNTLLFNDICVKRDILLKQLGMKLWSERELFEKSFQSIFKESPDCSNNEYISNFLKFRRNQKFLLGVQLRFGGWGVWDDPALMHPDIVFSVPKAIEVLKNKMALEGVSIYFCSDNWEAKQNAEKELSANFNFFAFDSKPKHLERSIDLSADALDFIYAEHFALSACDYILTGAGQFGVTAAYRGGVPFSFIGDLIETPYWLDFLCYIENKKRKFFTRRKK